MTMLCAILSLGLVAATVAQSNSTVSLRGAAVIAQWEEANASDLAEDGGDLSLLEEINESLAELSTLGYNPRTFCRTRGREGQNCISQRAYLYCSAHRPLKALSRDCWHKRGMYSRCHDGGIGLTYGECDDPFCRQQHGRRSHYCHNNAVVSCAGTGPRTPATPRTVEVCSNRVSDLQGCKVIQHFSCAETWGGASCQFSGTTYEGC